jgi:hypothetical protein
MDRNRKSLCSVTLLTQGMAYPHRRFTQRTVMQFRYEWLRHSYSIWIWGSQSDDYEELCVWDMTRCRPVKVNWRFGRTYHLHLQGPKLDQARNEEEAGWSLLPASCWFFPLHLLFTTIQFLTCLLEGHVGPNKRIFHCFFFLSENNVHYSKATPGMQNHVSCTGVYRELKTCLFFKFNNFRNV